MEMNFNPKQRGNMTLEIRRGFSPRVSISEYRQPIIFERSESRFINLLTGTKLSQLLAFSIFKMLIEKDIITED